MEGAIVLSRHKPETNPFLIYSRQKIMRNTLICTVGTSLLYPNLSRLPSHENLYESWLKTQPEEDREHLPLEFVLKLRDAFTVNNIETLAKHLGELPGTVRLCGAEINSVTDLVDRDYCSRNCQLFFCYSQTPDGKKIADILQLFYKVKGYKVIPKEILDLQDENPKLFRTKGLRNLAKVISGIIREQTSSFVQLMLLVDTRLKLRSLSLWGRR